MIKTNPEHQACFLSRNTLSYGVHGAIISLLSQMGLKYWFPSLRVFVLGIMCVQLVMHVLHDIIDNCVEQTSNMSCTKISPERKIFTVSLQHLDSGPWSGTEQAWLWLGMLGDLWQRLMALCCVWGSVALRRPTKITVLSPPLLPHFQSSLWLIEKNCQPFSSPFSLLLSPARDNKNPKVMLPLWLQENVGL